MPDTLQKKTMDGVTTNTTGTAIDVRDHTALAIYASAVGGTSVDLAIHGTADPSGQAGYAALAMRAAGGGAYATTAVSVTPAAPVSRYLDPSDNVQWIRAVTTNQSGPTALTVFVVGEK